MILLILFMLAVNYPETIIPWYVWVIAWLNFLFGTYGSCK